MNPGVMVYYHIGRSFINLKQSSISAPFGGANIVKEVVAYGDSRGLHTGGIVTTNVKALACMADDIVRKGNVLNTRPTSRVGNAVDDNGKTHLGHRPVVFKDVTLNHYPPRIFQLKKVLNTPRCSAITGVANAPAQGLV